MHHGHIRLFERCARLGSLTVGVNSDRFTASYKRPALISQSDRCELVAAVRCVSGVIVNDGPGRRVIELLKPDFLAVGSDWHGRYLEQINVQQEWLDLHGVTVVYFPRTAGVSSTSLREDSVAA